jgi:hypothetical protein
MDDIPMFDVPAAARRRAPKQPGFIPAGHIVWTPYRPAKALKCDHCKLFLVQHDGQGPPSLDARWRRKTSTGDMLLCHQHGQLQRGVDGLPKLDVR